MRHMRKIKGGKREADVKGGGAWLLLERSDTGRRDAGYDAQHLTRCVCSVWLSHFGRPTLGIHQSTSLAPELHCFPQGRLTDLVHQDHPVPSCWLKAKRIRKSSQTRTATSGDYAHVKLHSLKMSKQRLSRAQPRPQMPQNSATQRSQPCGTKRDSTTGHTVLCHHGVIRDTTVMPQVCLGL